MADLALWASRCVGDRCGGASATCGFGPRKAVRQKPVVQRPTVRLTRRRLALEGETQTATHPKAPARTRTENRSLVKGVLYPVELRDPPVRLKSCSSQQGHDWGALLSLATVTSPARLGNGRCLEGHLHPSCPRLYLSRCHEGLSSPRLRSSAVAGMQEHVLYTHRGCRSSIHNTGHTNAIPD